MLPTFSSSSQRRLDRDSRPFPGCAFEHERCIDLACPLLHAPDAIVPLRAVGTGGKAAAVIFHSQRHPRRLVDQLHVDARGARMTDRVGHRLLANT